MEKLGRDELELVEGMERVRLDRGIERGGEEGTRTPEGEEKRPGHAAFRDRYFESFKVPLSESK